MSINLNTAKLPTEHPIKDALLIYLGRLGIYFAVVVASFLIIGGILLYPKVFFTSIAVLVILLGVLPILYFGKGFIQIIPIFVDILIRVMKVLWDISLFSLQIQKPFSTDKTSTFADEKKP
jgi:hypothetical protein